ncbi:MAG TPA: hypothetical protein VGN17_04930 [Bryobacteraceae bacterium]|jgi:hypothetical protein
MYERQRDDILRTFSTGLALTAVQHGRWGKHEDNDWVPQEFELLAAIWLKKELMVCGEPDQHPKAAFGFLPDRQAMWFRRAELAETLTRDSADLDLFYDSGSVVKRLRKSWTTLPDGSDIVRHQPLAELVEHTKVLVWLKLLGVDSSLLWNSRRAVIVGNHAGVTWLGYRENPGIGTELQKNDEASWRANRLQTALQELILSPFAPHSVPFAAWQQPAVETAALNAGVGVCRDLLNSLGRCAVDGSVDVFHAKDDPTPAVVGYLESLTPEHVTSVLDAASVVLERVGTHRLILCSVERFEDVAGALRGGRVIAPGLWARSVALVAREQVLALLPSCPWVWSKYFGTELGFHVVRQDAEHLGDALGLTLAERLVVGGPRAAEREAVAAFGALYVTHVVGHPGTGKTVFVFQQLRRAWRRLVVIVIRTSEMVRWDLLDNIARSSLVGLLRAGEEVVFVLDDAFHALSGRSDVMERTRQVMGALSRSHGDRPGLVLTYRTADLELMRSAFGQVFASDVLVEWAFLDHPPREFLRAVIRSRLLDGEQLSDASIEAFLDRLEVVDGTVRALRWVLWRFGTDWERAFRDSKLPEFMYPEISYDDDFIPRLSDAYWARAIKQLSVPELVIMRLLRCCREYWAPRIPEKVAREYFTTVLASDPAAGVRAEDFDSAVRGLVRKAWMNRREDDGSPLLFSDDVRLRPVFASKALVGDFARWIAAHYPEQLGRVTLTGALYAAGYGWQD